MTTKIMPAQIINGNCHSCLYCSYDSNYGMSYDSGYDCHHEDSDHSRIADDYQITQYRGKLDEAERLPLLPEIVEDRDPMSIPEWCPLEDA